MTAHFRSFFRTLLASTVLALATSATANAAIIQLRAWLDGAQVPLPVEGTGQALVSFDTVTKVLSWSVAYTGLSGPCTDAHFHGPASAGVNNDPTVPMSCSASPLVGSSAPLDATKEAQLLSGQWYINIHTGANPGGEIRGQVLPVRGDFNADGRADVLWRNFSSGENYMYLMDGTSIIGEGYLRTVTDQAWRIKKLADFNGDGKADILWRNNSTGENYLYFMDGTSIIGEGYLRTVADQDWQIAGVGDFNGDGKADILWRNEATGENYIYLMDGASIIGEGYLRTVADLGWYVADVGDFNGDGKADVLWRYDGIGPGNGQNYIYLMDGTTISGEGFIRTVADMNWEIVGVADFDGDGRADILWRNFATGENYLYPMSGLAIRPTEGYLRTVADLNWSVVSLGDFDGDGRADILWRNQTTGENYLYPMGGTSILGSEGYLRTVTDLNWKVVGFYVFEDEGEGPALFVQNAIFGTFGGGTTGVLDFPANYASKIFFISGLDATPAPSVFFTGPMGSGLASAESTARFASADHASYQSPQQLNVALPGGLWTVNYEGQDIHIDLPDPDTNNRFVILVPTVTLGGQNLAQIDWVYRNLAGATVPAPTSFADSVELRIEALVGGQVMRVYRQEHMSVSTTSHVLSAPVPWTDVTAVDLIIHDNLGNEYLSRWHRAAAPAPVISGIDPASGTVSSQITINGMNFGCINCGGEVIEVRFTGQGGSGPNGVAAAFNIVSATQITATVPAGALSGPVWVRSNGGTSTSAQSFTVQP